MLSFEPANRSPEIRGHVTALMHPEQQDVLHRVFRGHLARGTQEIVIHLAKIQRVYIETVGLASKVTFDRIGAWLSPQERYQGGCVENHFHARSSSSSSPRLRLMKSSLLV